MSQSRYAMVPPPRKRSNTLASVSVSEPNNRITSFVDSGRWLSIANTFDSTTESVQSEEFDSYTSCLKHGRLKANLCERCMRGIATRTSRLDHLRVEKLKLIGSASNFVGQSANFLYNAATSPFAFVLLKFLWRAIQVLLGVASACFVCFFMMWLVQPSMSPQERKRKEIDDLHSKAADDEWNSKRDRVYAERQSEQLAWEQEREENYRQEKQRQEEWEDQRDLAYRQKLAEHDAWRTAQNEFHRDNDQEYNDIRKKEDEERHAVAETRWLESRALLDQILNPKSDLKNNLLKLQDVRAEARTDNSPESNQFDRTVDTALADAANSRQQQSEDARDEARGAYRKLIGNPTNDRSFAATGQHANDEAEERKRDAEEFDRY
ncbi:MAG: hypothetical protein SGJ27_23345 [Candidatus Melainabacteria bacterium]|nr:hypothetical protein [Candidatus Melainabacteria bacterium]